MITKGYTADLLYTVDVASWMDAWVWKSGRAPIPVRYRDAQEELVLIGHMRPIRWWRETVRKASGVNEDIAMICFNVNHERGQEKRMGDFCGSHHRIVFGVLKGVAVSAEVEKQGGRHVQG